MGFAKFHHISCAILRPIAHTEAHGLENIPKSGSCVVAINHLSSMDVPLVAKFLPRDDTSFLVAKKHYNKLWVRWLVDSAGGIWVDRTQADFGALRQARKLLQRGYMLGIAPEGTRSPTGALIQGKPGAAFLASSTNTPILPVAITGTEKGFEQLRRLLRPHLAIRFGEPFTLPPLDRQDRDRSLRQNTAEIMCRIAALLPPKYRGVYANHPRLKALLEKREGFL